MNFTCYKYTKSYNFANQNCNTKSLLKILFMKNYILWKICKPILKFLIKFISHISIKIIKIYTKVKFKLFINYKKIINYNEYWNLLK